MRVGTGWATDFAKVKFYVEIEESDLEILLREEGLEDAPLLLRERYALMKSEADILSASAMHGHFPEHGPNSPSARLAAAKGLKSQRLATIRNRLNGDPSE